LRKECVAFIKIFYFVLHVYMCICVSLEKFY
jgi:hypothetical protein